MCGQDVAAVEVEVVIRPVKVGLHSGVELSRAVGRAQLDASDLCQGAGLVGRLQRAREQILLDDRLAGLARVDARAAEIQQLRHVVEMRRVDHGPWIITSP